MQLTKDGQLLLLSAGDVWLKAEYVEQTGVLALNLENHRTGSIIERSLLLAPWSPDSYEVYEWSCCDGLVLCGAGRIIVLRTSTLQFTAGIAMEFQEAETIARPWIVELADRKALIVATDRRILCIEQQLLIKWLWSAQVSQESTVITRAPRALGAELNVSLESFRRGRSDVILDIDQGCPAHVGRPK